MILGGAKTIARIRCAGMPPNTSLFLTSNIVNKAATPAPSECPTIVKRYLHNKLQDLCSFGNNEKYLPIIHHINHWGAVFLPGHKDGLPSPDTFHSDNSPWPLTSYLIQRRTNIFLPYWWTWTQVEKHFKHFTKYWKSTIMLTKDEEDQTFIRQIDIQSID